MSTKIAIKSNKVTPFGGIFYVLNQFDRFIGRRVDTDAPGVTTTQKVVTCALEHAEFIYIRAKRCASLYEKVKKRSDWGTVEIYMNRPYDKIFVFEWLFSFLWILG